MSKNFLSIPDFLPTHVHFLEGGASVNLEFNGDPELVWILGEQEREYNWPVVTEYFRFIVSEENVDGSALTLPALPGPYLLSDRDRDGDATTKGFVIDSEESIAIKRWQTQLLEIVAKNPLYNTIDEDTLQGLLAYEETTQF